MGSRRDSRNQEIAKLQRQLAKASQLLDELEKRSRRRACETISDFKDYNDATSVEESAELRFAACVASGMTKLYAG